LKELIYLILSYFHENYIKNRTCNNISSCSVNVLVMTLSAKLFHNVNNL